MIFLHKLLLHCTQIHLFRIWIHYSGGCFRVICSDIASYCECCSRNKKSYFLLESLVACHIRRHLHWFSSINMALNKNPMVFLALLSTEISLDYLLGYVVNVIKVDASFPVSRSASFYSTKSLASSDFPLTLR